MADDILKNIRTWRPSGWCVLTVAFTIYATNTTFNYFRTHYNMSAAKEIIFPKIILFGDSITQVSVLIFVSRAFAQSLVLTSVFAFGLKKTIFYF